MSIISQPRQLSIFEPQFDDRVKHKELEGQVRFSILDVFEHYGSEGSASNPATYWARAKKRLIKQGSDLTGLLDWRDDAQSGGKPTPMATFEFFMRMVQVVEIKEWEPLRAWMAEIANERLEEYRSPGLGTQRAKERDLNRLKELGYSNKEALSHLEVRIDVMDTFKSLTSRIAQICDNPQYGTIINKEYLALFGAVAKDLESILNTKSIRDALPTLQLTYLKTAEISIREMLRSYDKITMTGVISVINDVVIPLGEMLRKISAATGKDHITGKPLLKDGN